MEVLTVEFIKEISALATVLIILIVGVWRGVPALIAYLERKDVAHRNDLITLLDSAKAEREEFYKRHGMSLDRLHTRLDKIESAIRESQGKNSSISKIPDVHNHNDHDRH